MNIVYKMKVSHTSGCMGEYETWYEIMQNESLDELIKHYIGIKTHLKDFSEGQIKHTYDVETFDDADNECIVKVCELDGEEQALIARADEVIKLSEIERKDKLRIEREEKMKLLNEKKNSNEFKQFLEKKKEYSDLGIL